MNATRLNANPLSQDLQPSRPVLSGGTRGGGGLLSSLLRSLLPSRTGDAKPASQRAEPRLQSAQVEEAGSDDRRKHLLL